MTKKISILLLLFAIVTINAKKPQHEVITKSLSAVKGGTLEVKLNPGDVRIKTWDKNEVLVKIDGLSETDAKELEFSERNGNVKVTFEGKWGWGKNADYYFTIPTSYNVEIYTTGGGIKVQDDIGGNFSVETMGGDVELQAVSGNAKIETMGGDISLTDVTGSSYISTQGGDIKAGDLKGNTKEVRTMGGDIEIKSINEVRNVTTYGGDITIDKAGKNINVKTFGGNITINDCTEGANVETFGGSILVRNANGMVDASSAGGNITLKNITGAVRARTGAGDVEVELKANSNLESDIRTTSGDIELIVFPGSKMTIKAQVDSYYDSARSSIVSDYEGKISENRGDVTGEFKVNGGGPEVKIRATNGKISIQKK